jgi:hypothetical protein
MQPGIAPLEGHAMALKELIAEISLRAAKMTPSERISRIRELAASKRDAKFIQDHFPELYREAFPRAKRVGDGSSELDRPSGLAAKQL